MISGPALAAVSAAILAYEVLLVRLFAITQWHHFASMAISIALLGFGISGALLAVSRGRLRPEGSGGFAAAAALFAVTSTAAVLTAQRLPFNALEIVWNPAQLLYLGAIYLVLAVPFTCGATCIGLAFMQPDAAIGRVYRWNLLGSGAGALGAVGALAVLAPMQALAAVSALALAAGALVSGGPRLAGIGALGLAGAAFWTLAPPNWTELRISPYKGLPRALLVQDARLAREYSGPMALVSAVESPKVPFRHAPGLSLLAPELPGEQIAVFVDADQPTFIERFDEPGENAAHLRYATDALVSALVERPSVLVLGAGGGRGVLQAVVHGAAEVDATEIDATMIRLVARDFAGFAGELYQRPEVAVHLAEPRSFLAGGGAWDVVRLPDLGASSGGAGGRGLGETYPLTVEAFGLYLAHLRPGGWVSVTGAVDLPPRGALKLVATAIAALERRGAAAPAEHLVMIRSLTSFTLLVGEAPVSAGDVAAMQAFADSRAFDVVWSPGMRPGARPEVVAEPELRAGVAALLGPEREAFVARYKFAIVPATDDRPYFYDFFRWRSAPELFALRALGGAGMLEWGEIVLAATLVQATALSAALILLQLALGGVRRPRGRIAWGIGSYFFAVGLAFMFVEIAYVQRFTLFLGHPLYAVAVVLTGFLVFAGVGAGASDALAGRLRLAPAVGVAVLGIAAVALGYLAALPAVFGASAHLPGAVRAGISLALIAPLAICMGMPFPLGLARIARSAPALVPWAWGLNGCASVAGAAGATLLAMHLGFAAVIMIATALYALAALAFPAGDGGRAQGRRDATSSQFTRLSRKFFR